MDSIEILKRVLENDSPLLFLGAGFSLGGNLNNGYPFPTGNQLKMHLITEYLKLKENDDEYKELVNYNLDKVCEYIETLEGSRKISEYLFDYFRSSKPADFHNKLTSFNWRKIYSVNIDDIVEQVYATKSLNISLQNTKVKSTIRKNGSTELIKLHGCVNNPTEGMTFSTQQYIDSMVNSRDYRFTSLSLDMHSEPLIIVGATFSEINIDYYLKLYENAGYTSLRGKMFLINPNPPLLIQKKIEKLGGFIIQWTTEEFLNFLSENFNNGIPKAKRILKELKEEGFLDTDDVKKHLVPSGKYTGNLYWGYYPKWEDIFYEWDFINNDISKRFDEFMKKYENSQNCIFSIVGRVLSGKSVYLKRIALILKEKNFQVIYFTGRSIDIFSLRRIITGFDSPRVAVLVDDASHYYFTLKKLLKKLPTNIQIVVVTTSRPYFHYRYRYQFVGENFGEHEINPIMTTDFSINVARKLEEKGYLGILKRYDDLSDRARAVFNHKDLISFLYTNTYGKGFKNRFITILERKNLSSDSQDLLVSLSLFSILDLPYFPFELASIIYQKDIEEMLSPLDDILKEHKSDRLELRADFISQYFLKKTPNWKKIEIIKTILVLISPLVSEDEYTYWNEIQSCLIKEKFLRLKLSLKNNEINQMLYDIRNYYSNDFNYWIQLGISEQIKNEFDKALNHFRTAESLRPNSYMVKNSIGRNFLRHARFANGRALASSYFEEGEKILLKLIREEDEYQARAYATHCYLGEKIEYLNTYPDLISTESLNKMSNVLDYLLERDPEDPMTMQINNKFITFLKRHRKFSLFSYSLKDLNKLKPVFQDYFIDIDSMFD